VLHFSQSFPDKRVLRLQINPPDGGRFIFGVRNGGIALSPDGRTAAFVASGDGKSGLWVRPLDGASARLLATADGIMAPFWSPDSRSVGYFAAGKLQRVDLAGGAPISAKIRIDSALAGAISSGHVCYA
jgi:Tol biopolymer transport system component